MSMSKYVIGVNNLFMLSYTPAYNVATVMHIAIHRESSCKCNSITLLQNLILETILRKSLQEKHIRGYIVGIL